MNGDGKYLASWFVGVQRCHVLLRRSSDCAVTCDRLHGSVQGPIGVELPTLRRVSPGLQKFRRHKVLCYSLLSDPSGSVQGGWKTLCAGDGQKGEVAGVKLIDRVSSHT